MTRTLALLCTLSVATPALAGDLTPKPHEPAVAALVADMLERYHYETRTLDDEVSERWFDGFLQQLDYARLYFLQSDIDEFEQWRDQLDDEIRSDPPELDVAARIYERYQQRVDERVAVALELLEGEFELDDEESWVPDRADADLPWPATTEEADELWRKRLEEEMIVGLLSGETEDEVRDRLRNRYERYGKAVNDWESVDVLEMWLSELAGAFDPHSAWFKPATNDNFDIEITNSVEGIGASLQTQGDYTVVMSLIPGGPAFLDDRLQVKDKILKVAQGREDPVDVVGLRIDKVVKLIRGEKGSEVRLTVRHENDNIEVVDLIRDRVMLEETDAEKEVFEVDGRKLGVIDLPSFYVDPDGKRSGKRASQDVKRLLGELEEEGVEGVVLDLRRNGGGSLIEAVDLAGLFVKAGPMVQVRDRRGRIEALRDSDSRQAWDRPLVVLTDATSASASEIVAGAIQDYGRGVIVGSHHTHGKGTVQQVAPLGPQLPVRGPANEDLGGALKLTVQKFYRVSGGSTQHKGVEADVVLPSFFDGMEVYESDLDNALPWDRIPPIPHARAGDLSEIVPELQARSEARVAESEDFDKLQKMLAEREAMDAEPEVSLHFETRKAEYEARKERTGAEDEPEAHGGDDAEGEDDGPEDDYVRDEALEVLSDLVELSAEA